MAKEGKKNIPLYISELLHPVIQPHTIQQIFEAARIEEVVGEFVALKKRGVTLLGICPFHNEKTPSFTVSPTKGIFKCFGCGKGGNSVHFLMEHEHYTYPEALRYLAKKFHIDIQEEEPSPEQQQELNERESLYQINGFAHKHFQDNLWETDLGKAIGVSYLKERNISEQIAKKFQLGYTLESWDDLTSNALKQGYNIDYLLKSGLTVKNEDKQYDKFRGRVMFPFHNLSGRVIGFTGRKLNSDKNSPKYVNSSESDIFYKGKYLYGLYFAKNAIANKNLCYLVEGNLDVVSLFQIGIENVVASSGTALTADQIKLIQRYTTHITILYDGDAAGLKASLRGIDIILEEGMDVRIVLFPEGEDPDSFAQKHTPDHVSAYIQENAKDFVTFKAELLARESGNDPIKKAEIIKDIISSIALIPDEIKRSIFVKECSAILQVGEQPLLNELNKIRRSKFAKSTGTEANKEDIPLPIIPPEINPEKQHRYSCEEKEKEIIRLLLNLSHQPIITQIEGRVVEQTVANYITQDLAGDEITFDNPIYQSIFDSYLSQPSLSFQELMQKGTPEITSLVAELVTPKYAVSKNWEKHQISATQQDADISTVVVRALYDIKAEKINIMRYELAEKLKIAAPEEVEDLLIQILQVQRLQVQLAEILNRVIIK